MMTSPKLQDSERIVVKIGSALITDDLTGDINVSWMNRLAADIAELSAAGKEVVIVSSGTVAIGKKFIRNMTQGPYVRLEHKQAAASCGQVEIMKAYQQCFFAVNLNIAQILITIEDTENRRQYINARSTINTLIQNGIIPIINENDTVATPEIRYGDNDRLAARVAQMIEADHLVLLSDIDGLYTSNPHTDADARHIPVVEDITEEVTQMAGTSDSKVGTGGMITKLAAADIAIHAGCHMTIIQGDSSHPLLSIDEPGVRSTSFIAKSTPQNARKAWISTHLLHAGTVHIDQGAEKALQEGNSLLPVGATKVEGLFQRGDALQVLNEDGQLIAKGLSNFSSDEAIRIVGKKTETVEKTLGYQGRPELIHRNELVLL